MSGSGEVYVECRVHCPAAVQAPDIWPGASRRITTASGTKSSLGSHRICSCAQARIKKEWWVWHKGVAMRYALMHAALMGLD